MTKSEVIRFRVTPDEKKEIQIASGGNYTKYFMELHRNRNPFIDKEALEKLINTVFEKRHADKLIKRYLR